MVGMTFLLRLVYQINILWMCWSLLVCGLSQPEQIHLAIPVILLYAFLSIEVLIEASIKLYTLPQVHNSCMGWLPYTCTCLLRTLYTCLYVHSSLVLQSKSKYSELQYMSSSGDRVHGTTNVVEYSVVGPKVGNWNYLYTCMSVTCTTNDVGL